MNKSKKFWGIDISKDLFDVMDSDGNFYQFENTTTGFRKFAKLLCTEDHCVLESTGYYHYSLAYFLVDNNYPVSVVNPLKIKRFIQMHLSKVKTDRSDAKMICLYGQKNELGLWKGHSKKQQECLQITRALSHYFKQSTSIKNKIHGEKTLGVPSKIVFKSLNKMLKNLQIEIKELEEQLLILVKEDHQELLTCLESIPGLGRKTAIMLLVLTDGFKKFDKASELCSYAGITPVIRQSGSSIKGKSRIRKWDIKNYVTCYLCVVSPPVNTIKHACKFIKELRPKEKVKNSP